MNKRLQEIKESIKNENISYGEIIELQEMAHEIPEEEIELRQWAGINEEDTCDNCGSVQITKNSSGELQCDNCGYSETE